MIFGIAPQYERLPFQRPTAAGYYTPGIPQTAFFSHLRPFRTMSPVQAFVPGIPDLPTDMAPGIVRWQRTPQATPQAYADSPLPKMAPVPGQQMEGFRGVAQWGRGPFGVAFIR